MKVTEENLVEELRSKNVTALEFAIDTYGKLIYKVVYNILNSFGDKESIKECVSDIFTALWYNIKTYDKEKASFKSWIIAIAKYKAIDYKKKLMKASNIENIHDYSITDLNDIEEYILAEENKAEIIKVIKELGKTDYEIFIRRYFLEEPIDKIADSLDLTRQAVDNRLWRGRKRLKEKLLLKMKKEMI